LRDDEEVCTAAAVDVVDVDDFDEVDSGADDALLADLRGAFFANANKTKDASNRAMNSLISLFVALL